MERSFQLFLERHQPVPTLESILSSFLCIIEREEEEEEEAKEGKEEEEKMDICPKSKRKGE